MSIALFFSVRQCAKIIRYLVIAYHVRSQDDTTIKVCKEIQAKWQNVR